MPCHSSETEWSWYAHVLGVSVALVDDVENARSHMNFSEWDRPQDKHDDAPEKLLEGEMPPLSYRLAHPEADLTEPERRVLADGLRATFKADPPPTDDAE